MTALRGCDLLHISFNPILQHGWKTNLPLQETRQGPESILITENEVVRQNQHIQTELFRPFGQCLNGQFTGAGSTMDMHRGQQLLPIIRRLRAPNRAATGITAPSRRPVSVAAYLSSARFVLQMNTERLGKD